MAPGKWILPRKIWTNKHWIIFLCIISIFILVSSASKGGAYSLPAIDAYPLVSLIEPDLEEGDILLRRGSSFVSTLISRASPSAGGMSHCGIVVRDQGDWQIIHSISGSISDQDGIRMENLQSFADKAYRAKIKLVKPAFEIDRQLLAQRARYYLNQGAAFDHEFDLEDSSRLYCSELIRAVYLDSGAEDVFSYSRVAGKNLVDLSSFFQEAYWLQ
jgi:hypothetical protein